MSAWISTEQQMPPDNTEVLVVHRDFEDKLAVTTGNFVVDTRPTRDPLGWFRGGDCEVKIEVTHWMPLPAPPI